MVGRQEYHNNFLDFSVKLYVTWLFKQTVLHLPALDDSLDVEQLEKEISIEALEKDLHEAAIQEETASGKDSKKEEEETSEALPPELEGEMQK